MCAGSQGGLACGADRRAEDRRELRPSVACKEKARRIAELAALVEFRAQRYVALLRHLAGELGVLFPDGTYRVRGFFRTALSPPLAQA